VTALRAQRLLGLFALRVAPRRHTAGVMAAFHLSARAGEGVLVFVSMLAASAILRRDRYPTHLMPLVSFLQLALVPVFGAAIALGVLALAGTYEPVSSMIVAGGRAPGLP